LKRRKIMTALIGFELDRLLQANLPQGRGVSAQEPGLQADRLQVLREQLRELYDGEAGTFVNAAKREETLGAIALAKELKGKFSDFLLVGIGGSTWGTIAIQAALCHGFWNENEKLRGGCPRFRFLDNSDPDALREILETIDPATTLVNVVSKSGTTAETAANFMSLRTHFQQVLGDAAREHFVLTTDSGDGLLQRIAADEGFRVLRIPPETGGRFSLLTAVGIFPAAMLGLDVVAMLDGSEAITQHALQAPLEENRVLQTAAIVWRYLENGTSIHVLMPYSRRLRHVADWFVQLWGESLGKRHDLQGRECFAGSTPLGALGAADQHSLLQLFMEGPADKLVTFLAVDKFGGKARIGKAYDQHAEINYLGGRDLAELIHAEQDCTAQALLNAGRGSRILRLPKIDAYYLGQLFQYLMLETWFVGGLMGVDPFGQPGVEAGKILTNGQMGREGFTVPDLNPGETLRF
jgi:glucose-6-phosphate isomerase